MKLNGTVVFISMQVFFVVLGLALFFGLKSLKDSRAGGDQQPVAMTAGIEKASQESGESAPGFSGAGELDAGYSPEPAEEQQDDIKCDFPEWVGAPADEDAVKATGRPYRILPPGSMVTMDHNPERINIHTDENGLVIKTDCG